MRSDNIPVNVGWHELAGLQDDTGLLADFPQIQGVQILIVVENGARFRLFESEQET